MFKNINQTYREFPTNFWILMGASFIDHLGGALLFPFFALYVTFKFNVGMTEVGILFAIWAITNQIGSVFGGALTDKFGRKPIIIFGLIVSALSIVVMGLLDSLELFYIAAAFVGLLGDMGGPAQQAMVADLLPEKQRTQGYSIWRVIANFAVMLGPLIGGFMATRSYLLLFIADAISSTITALIVLFTLPETKPEAPEDKAEESLMKSFRGYGTVAKDWIFVAFLFITIFMNIVYVQISSTLPVYMRDIEGMPILYYSYILSMNAAMVVFFQFWITRRLTKLPPMLTMALGAIFYLIGFGMFGFVSGIWLFALGMAILTIGEMVVIPTAQGLVARLAPEDMRGRYMAAAGLAWTIPFAVGTYLAGLIMDNPNVPPEWIWYAAGMIGAATVLGYLWLHWKASERIQEPELEAEPA